MTAIEESQQTIEGVKGTEGWVAVATASESESYDWRAISFYYSPSDRRYFWYSDGGCSCNWHMDSGVLLADFEDGDKQAALRAATRWPSYGEDEGLEQEIRDFKEPK